MFRLLKSLIRYKIGKKVWSGVARSVGMGRLVRVAGVIGGLHHMRRHSSSH